MGLWGKGYDDNIHSPNGAVLHVTPHGLGFRVQGSGFGVWGFEFGVWGYGVMGQGLRRQHPHTQRSCPARLLSQVERFEELSLVCQVCLCVRAPCRLERDMQRPYTIHLSPYTLHPTTPCTLHPAPYTLHPYPGPYTLKPSTRNPKPGSLPGSRNPKPQTPKLQFPNPRTLNPKPHTPNPRR